MGKFIEQALIDLFSNGTLSQKFRGNKYLSCISTYKNYDILKIGKIHEYFEVKFLQARQKTFSIVIRNITFARDNYKRECMSALMWYMSIPKLVNMYFNITNLICYSCNLYVVNS